MLDIRDYIDKENTCIVVRTLEELDYINNLIISYGGRDVTKYNVFRDAKNGLFYDHSDYFCFWMCKLTECFNSCSPLGYAIGRKCLILEASEFMITDKIEIIINNLQKQI